MFNSKKLAILVVLLMVAPMVLAACAATPETIVETVEKEVTVVIEKEGEQVTVVETIVETVEVEKEVVVEVTAEPEAAPLKDTLVVCMSQEPDTLYHVTSNMAVQRNVMAAYANRASASDTAYWFYTDFFVDDKLPSLEDGTAELIGEEGPEGQIVITYNIKPDIYWHDGEQLTAEDFVYSFDVQNDPESGVTSRTTLERVESCEVVDDLTYRVTLK
jgi:peptide/nickel transport system substrate-binding protein